MAMLREWLLRLWGALRRDPTDQDLERELRFHLEHAEEELRAKGHSPGEAARLARVRLGGVPQTMEALRDQRGWPWLDDLRIDLRIGVRGLAPASWVHGYGGADAVDRHRGDGGDRHGDERVALSAAAGARPGGARRGGAAR